MYMKIHELLNVSPDDVLAELNFHGSRCTKDCSGHKAGYKWSSKHPNKLPNSNSPSFDKGAVIGNNVRNINRMRDPKNPNTRYI